MLTSVLLIGNHRLPEFADAVTYLHQATLHGAASVQAVDSIESALAAIAGGDEPALVVIVQSRPGEFSVEQVEELRRAAPLLRLVALLGSWCEGELRSGTPWSADLRCYWHQWPSLLKPLIQQLTAQECPPLGLPQTALDEERILHDLDATFRDSKPGTVAVVSDDFDSGCWIVEVFNRAGFSAVSFSGEETLHPSRNLRQVQGVIWIGTGANQREMAQLVRLVRDVDPAPVLALLDFPRWEDRQRVLQAGAVEVLSKPLGGVDLIRALLRAIPSPADSQHADLGA